MNQVSLQSLKIAADELAALMNSNYTESDEIDALLSQFNLSNAPCSSISDKFDKKSNFVEEYIGIWKKCINGNDVFYERDPGKTIEWLRWNNQHRIYLRKSKKRIILIGESVARGYFYDPYYTVAMELESIINANFKPGFCEVIDLAKTSILVDELSDLAGACKVLKPDALVIFAGNNWISKLRVCVTEGEYVSMLDIFKTESLTGVKNFLEKKLESVVVSFLKEIEIKFIKYGIPVVFLIPGFNLKDWKSDNAGKNHVWLPADSGEAWLNAKSAAEAALANGQYDILSVEAQQMIAIDPLNPLGYELLGEYYFFNNKWKEAITCMESCRDACMVSRGGNEHPRCLGIIRETILSYAGKFGIKVVDLPEIFNNSVVDCIPGRDLYLDYCHLTVKGIKMSMRHAATTLIPLISNKNIPDSEIKESNLELSNDASAMAHFGAAIHNAHSGQPIDILRYHCQKSIRYSDSIKETMLQFIDLANRNSDTVLCKSFEEIMLGGKLRQYEGGYGLIKPEEKRLLDLDLVDAISESLNLVGTSVHYKVNELRKNEHLIGKEWVSLLASYYNTTSIRYLDIIDPKPVFLKIRSTENSFSFIADDSCSLTFKLVYRTPERYSAEKTLNIFINNIQNAAIKLPMSATWTTHIFCIDHRLLRDGVNKIIIKWPYTFKPLRDIDKNNTAYSNFLDVVLPVLGEIHEFSGVRSDYSGLFFRNISKA